jgi:light-regulated signal transduction histidine kinase (bacteriophytochrome)
MEQTRADLERSNRDLEQFANIVAHDLKSPLRAVIMHLGLISRKLADALDEKTKRSLEFAVNGAERMQALIDALFTYAKLGFCEPAMSTFCLNEAVKNAQNDLSAISKETHAQITHDTLPQVTGNPVMLSQLLQNLIANAIKYCKVTPRIHISASLLDGKWRISVRDNGIGIPAAQHEKIFAIFRRLHLDEEYPGIGLGLAICKRIVTLHDGEISVESAPDEGSVFHFTLPAASAPLEQKKVAHG